MRKILNIIEPIILRIISRLIDFFSFNIARLISDGLPYFNPVILMIFIHTHIFTYLMNDQTNFLK
jgi:hypothetical protein